MSQKIEDDNKIPDHAKCVFRGKIFEVWQWEQKMYDGSIEIFERLKRPDTTQVIASVGDKILLQIQEQPDRKIPFPSLPGGRCEEGESPLECAKRELLEETGFASDNWLLWKEQHPVQKIEWAVRTFVAKNCTKIQGLNLDVGEKIENRLITFDELIALADDPNFSERELVVPFLRAKNDPTEYKKLHDLIFV